MALQVPVQVRLRSGSTERTCWVDRRVRAGDRITLKSEDPARLWDVTWASSSTEPPMASSWHVGGL